tara:strand:+ start:817 stop:1140 length:324 start_codon:yes stop_codon:yes gene_type:complete
MHDFYQYKSIQVPIGGRMYTLYVADDREKRTKGLSGIRYLSSNEGMLFKHSGMGNRSYTMEETHIPLHLIFIDDDFNIVSEMNAKAQQKEEVNPGVDFMYVIEILGR